MKKQRIDLLMVEKGLVSSRSLAQKLIMAGQVRANGQIVLKPATKIASNTTITIKQKARYVSRGGEKLAAALKAFDLDVTDKVCADVGSSTGGFTDCLLQNGANRVYAIDVGKGILHWRLRNDPNVIVMESTNARYIENLPESIDLVTIDASFISLRILLPVVKNWFSVKGENKKGKVVALIKPQFEAGRKEVSKGHGVIRSPEMHLQVLKGILEFTQQSGYKVLNLIQSPLIGPKGNKEFLVYLVLSDNPNNNLDQLIEMVLPTLFSTSKNVSPGSE